MLKVFALSFDYQDKPLFSKVEFSLAAGQLLHLKGANGSGKTTLLKLLAGLLCPVEGEIYYSGKLISKNIFYQQQICYVGHSLGINGLLTVRENCLFDLHWDRRGFVFESLLEEFGLQKLADTPCAYLSAGQKHRVGLLRIALTDAKLWLLDEPLLALDFDASQTLINCIEKHLMNDGQVILTSHQPLGLNFTYQEYLL